MDHPEERLIATLISSNEYSHHLNEVLAVTTHKIVFLKRKFFSSRGSELVNYDINQISTIEVIEEMPLYKIVFGSLLIFLIILIFYGIYIYWNDFEAGTRIKVGALGVALFYGFTWVFGAKRYRLNFTLKNGKKLKWVSSSGDFDMKSHDVERIRALAQKLGIYVPAK